MLVAREQQKERFLKRQRQDLITVPSNSNLSKYEKVDDDLFNEFMAKQNIVTASFVKLVVREGKYRMVRRMLHNCGHSVLLLHRIRYGNVELGSLQERQLRPATGPEVSWFLTSLSQFRKRERLNAKKVESANSVSEDIVLF